MFHPPATGHKHRRQSRPRAIDDTRAQSPESDLPDMADERSAALVDVDPQVLALGMTDLDRVISTWSKGHNTDPSLATAIRQRLVEVFAPEVMRAGAEHEKAVVRETPAGPRKTGPKRLDRSPEVPTRTRDLRRIDDYRAKTRSQLWIIEGAKEIAADPSRALSNAI